jgi:PAS domain-containing protein
MRDRTGRQPPGGSTTVSRAEKSARRAEKHTLAAAGPPDEPTAPEPTEALAALVSKLRTELTGVRTAMRNRAVIEQAKGVLVERLGISPDEGFDHLVRLSQRANVKLIEVAAAIVGTTAPDPDGAAVIELIDDELRDHLTRSRGRQRVTDASPTARTGGRRGRTETARRGRSATPGPAPAATGPGKRQTRPPAHEALQAQHQLMSARIASAMTFDEITEAVAGAVAGWPAPATVVITVLEPDGAHRFVGAYGMTARDRSEWARVPPQFDVPIVKVARDRTPLLLTDPQAVLERFPTMAEDRYGAQSVFAAPLFDGDRVIGSLGLAWREPLSIDDGTVRYLSALATPVARKTAELVSRLSAEHLDAHGAVGPGTDVDGIPWLPIVLDTVADPAVVLTPVWADGQVVDFRVEYANTPATELIAPTRLDDDATLLAIYPRIGSELLLPRFAELLRTGKSLELGPTRLGPLASGPAAAQVMTVQAGRVWDRVLMVWRIHGEAELIYPQLLDAERIARIGSFCWELDSDEPRCSPQLYRMYYGDEQPRPIRFGELATCVHEDDLLAVQDAVRRTLDGGEQLTWEFRGAGRLAGRRLRIIAEPVLDPAGTVTTIRGTVQDVTEERAMEARLRLAEEALAAQRRRVDAELRAAQALQRALLPTEPELGTTDGLWVSGRSRASQESGRVDGDWYDACALPGGATLLVVGDVAGSGLAAMTAAARLRYAVRAYAALDMSPGEILTAVNQMLCSLEPERTATLVVGRYEARQHRLTWAAAGQAAPVRYQRSGGAELLSGPLGLPVGAAPQVTYEDTTLELAAGDRLLLYTDSLVGARGTDLVGVLDVLLGAGAHAVRDDVEALVSHVVGALYAGPDADMGAMLVRVNS